MIACMQPVAFLFVYFKECTKFLFLDNKSTQREPLTSFESSKITYEIKHDFCNKSETPSC